MYMPLHTSEVTVHIHVHPDNILHVKTDSGLEPSSISNLLKLNINTIKELVVDNDASNMDGIVKDGLHTSAIQQHESL